MKLPHELAGFSTKSHDVAGYILDSGLTVTGLMTHQYHHHSVDYYGWRRCGYHAQFSRDAVIGIVAATGYEVVLPRPPVFYQVRYQIDHAAITKTLQRHRRSPVLQRQASLRIQCPEEEGRGSDVDYAAAIHLGIGNAFAVGLPG